MNYPVEQRIVDVLLDSPWPRDQITKALENKDYYSIWIDNTNVYNHINEILSWSEKENKSKKHLIIHQIEEDWFEYCDYYQVRNNIKNHSAWTDQSFIVTNSRQDKQKTLELGINAVCRPGLLDLITYRPYDINLVNFNSISFHTGVCWWRQESSRIRLLEMLKKQQNKVVVAKIGKSWDNPYVINNSPSPIFDSGRQLLNFGMFDSPYIHIQEDIWWAKYIAFGTVLETRFKDLPLTSSNNKLTNFTPTTSEKTYRNMHLLRPAVICAGRNTRDYLQALGFDTWDWFVDWSFDSEPDDQTRFEKFQQELTRLLNTPLHTLIDLINQNQDRLLYNRDRLFWLINNYDSIDI